MSEGGRLSRAEQLTGGEQVSERGQVRGAEQVRKVGLEADVLARAKLTLSLRVTGVRPDGYHLLDIEMVNVDLADKLAFSQGEGLEVVDSGAGAAGYGTVPSDGSNLVLKALTLLGRRAHVRLEKCIPAGAGLGGGSADAAAVLRWAGVQGPAAIDMAARLGSDVPFCVAGGGRARVTGVGEVLEPLPFEEVAARTYTLLVPPFGVSTAAVYETWDDVGGPASGSLNDLEPAALAWSPASRFGGTDWATPRGNNHCWPVAGRRGLCPGPSPGTGASSLGPLGLRSGPWTGPRLPQALSVPAMRIRRCRGARFSD